MIESKYIMYKSGYKHQTCQCHRFDTGIAGYEYDNGFLMLKSDGCLLIKSGYAWDGASGPTWDTKSTMRASLLHDALYQLVAEDAIPFEEKFIADNHLYRLMIEDGAWELRAKLWLFAVNEFGRGLAKEANTAP